jgi:hypothetical protein
MSWNIRYPKEHLARARATNRTAFAVGYDGPGRAEALMFLDDERATFAWLFVNELNQGKTPEEAFAATADRIARHKTTTTPDTEGDQQR